MIERDAFGSATTLSRVPDSAMIDQYASHERSSNTKKMIPVVPFDLGLLSESQVRLVHEGCGLQGMAGALAPQIKRRETPKFGVNRLDGCFWNRRRRRIGHKAGSCYVKRWLGPAV